MLFHYNLSVWIFVLPYTIINDDLTACNKDVCIYPFILHIYRCSSISNPFVKLYNTCCSEKYVISFLRLVYLSFFFLYFMCFIFNTISHVLLLLFCVRSLFKFVQISLLVSVVFLRWYCIHLFLSWWIMFDLVIC